jgi:hypothetical protein
MKIFRAKSGSVLSKLFSSRLKSIDDKITDSSRGAVTEIVKILVMGNACRGAVPHWIDILYSIFNRIPDGKGIQTLLGIVSNYKNLPRRISQSRIEKEIRNGKTVEEYIDQIYDYIENDTRRGENKYSSVLRVLRRNSELPDNETLIQKIKYVALCITGQIDYNREEWYSGSVQSTPVNWEWTGEVDKDQLQEIIKKTI